MFESFTKYQSRNNTSEVRSISMVRRIAAIVFIFVCASVAWAILGGTIFSRTYDSNNRSAGQVESLWGTPQNQTPPKASFIQVNTKDEESLEDGKKVVRKVDEKVEVPLPLESSRVDVALYLEHRQKGLLWYSTYKVNYAGIYSFHNTSDKERAVIFTLGFPASQAIYDALVFSIDDVGMITTNEKNAASAVAKIAPGKTA